jgi:hypothetical protein
LSNSGIQHKHTFVSSPGFGFGDDRERVPVVMPEHEKAESEISDEDERRVGEETIARFLSHLLRAGGTGTAEEIGRMVLVISYLMKHDDGPQTLEQVGALFTTGGKLGVGKARVSQILSALNLGKGNFTKLFD